MDEPPTSAPAVKSLSLINKSHRFPLVAGSLCDRMTQLALTAKALLTCVLLEGGTIVSCENLGVLKQAIAVQRRTLSSINNRGEGLPQSLCRWPSYRPALTLPPKSISYSQDLMVLELGVNWGLGLTVVWISASMGFPSWAWLNL